MKSAFERRLAADPHVGTGRVRRVAHARRACRRPPRCRCRGPGRPRRARCRRGATRGRRARPRRGCRRRRRTRARRPAPGSSRPSTRTSCGSSAPSPMPDRSSATRPCLRVARLGDACWRRTVPSCRSVAATTSASTTAMPAPRGDPAVPRDEPAPSASTRGSPCRRCAGAASRAAAPSFASTTGSSVIATSTRDQRDQHAAVAHRAQERQRQRDQREQADRDGHAAEHDGAAGGLHRPLDRLVALRPCARSSRQRETTISE